MKLFLIALSFFSNYSNATDTNSSKLVEARMAFDVGLPFITDKICSEMRLADPEISGNFAVLMARAKLVNGDVYGAEKALNLVPNFLDRSDYSINDSIIKWISGNKVAYVWTILRWRERDFKNLRDLVWYKFFKSLFVRCKNSVIPFVDKLNALVDEEIVCAFERLYVESELSNYDKVSESFLKNEKSFNIADASIVKKYAKLLFQQNEFSKLIKFLSAAFGRATKMQAIDKIKLLYLKALAQVRIGESLDETILSAVDVADGDISTFVDLLKLWLENSDKFDGIDKISFLSKLFEKKHRLAALPDIKLVEAEVRLSAGHIDVARSLINACLENGEYKNKLGSYLLLAKTYVADSSKNYRLAASFLKEARKLTKDDLKRFNLTIAIGNLLFLANDYTLAYNFYKDAISKLPLAFNQNVPEDVVSLYFISSILCKNENVGDELFASISNNTMNIKQYLQMEMFYIEQMLIDKTFENALKRIAAVAIVAKDFFEILCSFKCMQAYALVESGYNAQAKAILDEIDVTKITDKKLEARMKVVYGQLLISAGNHGSALKYFEDVCRMNNVGEDLHAIAFFSAANCYAYQKTYLKSQQLLLSFFEKYSNTQLAPLALYQAAVYCDQKGLAYAKETAEILNLVVDKFQGSPISYSAQVKQGELLMALNKYSEARLFFKSMIKGLMNNEKKHFCEFLELKCAIIESKESKIDISQKLEVLLNSCTYSTALRLEIAAHLATIYFELDKHELGAKLIWSQVFSFKALERYDNKEAYWASKCLFILAEHLEKLKMAYDATNAYKFIVDNQLPGAQVASTKIEFIKNE